MAKAVKIASKHIGQGHPVYIIGEIGLNHNGDVEVAKKLIDVASFAGCDAVKFQKRTPELCVPLEQRDIERDTPWGRITYMAYREKVEFTYDDYKQIDEYCKLKEIDWFASCWDEPSVDFIEQFEPVCYKFASASITNDSLLKYTNSKGRVMIMSSGMSTMEEIEHAVSILDIEKLMLCHATSTYPCKPNEINLEMINTLKNKFDCPIGYSGHEVGLQITLAAVAMGAHFVERHITLDRTMWGSDQAASVEPQGLIRLVRDIRIIEQAIGDGVKLVYDSEVPIRAKLRG